MKNSNVINSFKNRLSHSRKFNDLVAHINYSLRRNKQTKVFFIFGCQRSGTTILRNIIGKDISTKAYGEGEFPYFYPKYTEKRLRLRSREELIALLRCDRCQHALLKPLYESQWAGRLLNDFPDSKALWIYRNYIDVVDSHIRYYKNLNAEEYIKSALYCNTSYPWINENIDEVTLDKIRPLIKGRLGKADSFALYWYVRNTHYKKISTDPRVMIVQYENLVLDSERELTRIFKFFNLPFKQRYTNDIRADAVNRKVAYDIHPEIRKLCEEMSEQLNSHSAI